MIFVGIHADTVFWWWSMWFVVVVDVVGDDGTHYFGHCALRKIKISKWSDFWTGSSDFRKS